MTFRDLLKDALTEIGVLADGETPTAEALSSGLRSFNRMLGNWSTQNLLVNAQIDETFSLIANQSLYLMGPGGDFDTVCPKEIHGVSVMINGIESPCDILTEDEWQRVQLKGTASQIPCAVYPVATFPQYSFTFWPVPSDPTYSAKIYSLKPLTSIADVNASVILQPGYEMALLYDFSVLLCLSYSRPCPPELAAVATKSVADIKRANMRKKVLTVDSALQPRSRYNIFSGNSGR